MSAPISPPFRADHIGSLKRPIELLDARDQFAAGTLSQEELTKIEDKAIKEIVAWQTKLGIKSITDGEFRRHMFFDGFFDNLDGMELVSNPPREIFKMWVPDIKAFFESHAAKPADTWLCTSKLRRTKAMYVPQFEYTASLVAPEDVKNVKITLASPFWFHLRHLQHAYTGVYNSDAEYFADIAKAYREELADLYKAGCRNAQFDDPLLAYFCSQEMLTGMKADGVDSDKLLDSYIKLYNDCLEGKPKDFVVGVHLCRGNFKDGMHFSEGGYDVIASKLFKELNADTYYLEYDTARAGGFEPLADLPPHKSAVLGLVTSKFGAVKETPEELQAKIEAAAEFVAKGNGETKEQALARLCLSPQCGFASHDEGNVIDLSDVEYKLTTIVNTAKKIWSDA